MAYDKIIPIRARLDHTVNYILDHAKTSLAATLDYIVDSAKNTLGQEVLETAINCQLETVFQDMLATKRRWDKTGGVQGYHLIHSFAPGEVTPLEAHELGVEFATRLLGDRYEAVVSTHLDHDHLHCHILFNSVSFMDGRKFQNTFRDYFRDIRGVSNAISAERGLSVIQPESRGKDYSEWQAEKSGKATLRGLVRRDIDAAIARAFTCQTFWEQLEKLGYAVKRGPSVKHTAVRPPGGVRFIRLSSLGDGYTEEAIRERLARARNGHEPPTIQKPSIARKQRRYTVQGGQVPRRPRRKLQGFRALYVRYLYLLGIRRPPSPKRPPLPFSVRKEVTKLNRYAAQFRLLQAYRIDSAAQLHMLEDALQAEIDTLTDRRKELYRQKRRGQEVDGDIQTITRALRPLRSQLRTCVQVERAIPQIRAQERRCRDAMRKEKDHRTETIDKADKARPRKFSLPDR